MIIAETEEQLKAVLDEFYLHLDQGKTYYEKAFAEQETEDMSPYFEDALREHHQTLTLFNEILDLWHIALPDEKKFISTYIENNNIFDSRNITDFFEKAECQIKQYINDEKTWLVTLPVCQQMWHRA